MSQIIRYSYIITSLLDNDWYKITMLQAMFHNRQIGRARYEWLCRNVPKFALATLVEEVNAELDNLCSLRLSPEELAYLASRPGITPDFIDFLTTYQLNRNHVKAYAEGNDLKIVAEGPQLYTMNFEIYCMSIVSELYFRKFDQEALWSTSVEKLNEKIAKFKAYEAEQAYLPAAQRLQIFDFGVRRRYSKAWQEHFVATMAKELPNMFMGTSNVYLAMKYGLTPIGTMAHEWLQSFQTANVNLRLFQKTALEKWADEYRGLYSIALTDTIGMDAFLNDFDLYLSRIYDGMRHDSGCPFEWGEKGISHYNRFKIDPLTKKLVFSDGLDTDKALDLHRSFRDRALTGFGIGTHFTNDCGETPLNMVMKLMDIDDMPVAKISDAPGKTLCKDEIYVNYLKHVFNV